MLVRPIHHAVESWNWLVIVMLALAMCLALATAVSGGERRVPFQLPAQIDGWAKPISEQNTYTELAAEDLVKSVWQS